MAEEDKKSLFDKAIDALTNRDEKKAEEEARAKAEAMAKENEALRAKMEAERVAAEKAAAAKFAAEKAAADKAAAEKLAAEQAAAAKLAAERAAVDRAMAEKAAAAEAAKAAAPKKGVVTARSLHIRKDHNANSAEVGGLIKGNEVTILETWTDGTNTWARLGPDQWAAIHYKGETYIDIA
jgi:membrane protein involved in colicin uptake